MPPIIRFMSHVRRVREHECWLWDGMRAGERRRYGVFRPGSRQDDPRVYAHRFAYEAWIGPIPEGMELDHVKERGCLTTLCVNPSHLEPVTRAENMRRTRLTRCRSGRHDLTDPENMQWDKHGRRRGCRPCLLERARRNAAARYERMKQ